MHQQLTIEFDANKRRSVAHIRRSVAKPSATVCPKLPTLPVSQFLRDLALVSDDDCFFAAMGRIQGAR